MNWRGLPRRAFPYFLVAAIGLLSSYLILFFFAFPAEVIPDEGRMPNVVGLTFDRAARALGNAGFAAVEGETRFHRAASAGIVLQQDPPADSRQKRGTEVRLAISAGQRANEVPQVSGLAEQAARLALANAGFQLGTILRQNDDSPRGMVFQSDPPAGTRLQLPATVNLVISEGPVAISVPDLTGRTQPEARSLLEQLGLRLGRVSRDTNSFQPENTILRQSPAGGHLTGAGGSVDIVISRFPPLQPLQPDTFPIP